MDPLRTAAQFAAFIWFLRQEENLAKPRAEALAFARNHWARFLPQASAGLGRLVMKISTPRRKMAQRRRAAAVA